MMKKNLLLAPTLLLALGACSGNHGEGSGSGTSSSGGHSTSSSSSTSTGGNPDEPYTPEHTWTECQASDQAFVRRAVLAVSGRRTLGQAEINAYEDAIKGVRKADRDAAGPFGDIGAAEPPDGHDLENA